MNNKLLFLLLSILLMAGCTSEGRRLKTDTGFEYEILRKGSGDPILMNNYIFFNMSLMAGDSVMQSTASMGKPSVLKITEDTESYGQLKPLIDLIGTLKLNDSIAFYFPIDSFDSKPPGFENLTGPLVYHVGIVDIMDETKFQAFQDSVKIEQDAVKQVVKDRLPSVEAQVQGTYDAYKKGQLTDQMKTTESGVRYVIHEEGDGSKPVQGDQVSVHYYGILDADGKKFDTSFEPGQPYQFPLGVGQVIQGWDKGLMELNKGTKATLFIPAALAYGAAGRPPQIPENADLIFYVELEK